MILELSEHIMIASDENRWRGNFLLSAPVSRKTFHAAICRRRLELQQILLITDGFQIANLQTKVGLVGFHQLNHRVEISVHVADRQDFHCPAFPPPAAVPKPSTIIFAINLDVRRHSCAAGSMSQMSTGVTEEPSKSRCRTSLQTRH